LESNRRKKVKADIDPDVLEESTQICSISALIKWHKREIEEIGLKK